VRIKAAVLPLQFKNLVNIGPVTSEFQRVECGNCAATRPQFVDRPLFGILAFRNGLEYRNFDFSRLIGNHFSTLCKKAFGEIRFSDRGV